MFSGLINKYVVIGGVVLISIIGLFLYIRYLNSTIESLTVDNSLLTSAVEKQQKTILSLQKDFENVTKAHKDLAEKEKSINKKTEDLKKKLNPEQKGGKSLDEQASEDSKALEKQLNEDNNKFLRCIEILTGSVVMSGEDNDC